VAFAPRDYYQVLEKNFEGLLKKNSILPINQLFQKAKEEQQL